MTPSLPRTELSRIIRFLQANQGQFAFAFVRVNSWELRDRVIEELAGAVRPDLRVHVVDYADEDPPSLLADLQRRGDSVDPRGVLCLIGLERHFLGSSGFVRSMNHDRDGFPEAVLCPMLLWLSDAAADKLYADAPDFADWHSFAFRLDEEEDVARVELGPSLPVVESERSPFSESFLRERVQLLRTALGRDEREHGADHPAVALRLEQLAAALERLQQYPEALSAIVRALEIRAKAVGQPGGREQLAGVLLLKGNIERRLRMLAAAEASYDQALEIYDELVRGGRSDLREHVAGTLMNKGVALDDQKRFDEAVASYDRVLEIREELVRGGRSDRREDVATALMNKGIALRNQKRYEEAVASYDRALEIREELVRGGRSDLRENVATALMNTGVALDDLKRHEEAVASYNRALQIYEQLERGGRSDLRENVATALMNKGIALRKQKRYEEAVASYDRALGTYEELVRGGRSDLRENVAEVLENKHILIESLGDLASALLLIERAVGIRRELHTEGYRHQTEEFLRGLEWQAQILDSMGRHADAAACRAEAERIRASG